jgi:hypothetical protein
MVQMYDEQKRAFNAHINCDEAGKKLILTAFPNMYTSTLETYLLGYVGVTVWELVQYIIHTYSRIDPTQMADCYTKMTRPYDLQDPIETLFTKIDDGVRYALAAAAGRGGGRGAALRGSPVRQHCVLTDPVNPESPIDMCWMAAPSPQYADVASFQSFFTEAHRESRMISQTALHSGYHTANMATEIPSGPFEASHVARQYHQTPVTPTATTEITAVLANLATATDADRATVAALTKSLA